MTAGARVRRTGVMGGTFDPIHVGHLDAAEAARMALGLDEVLLVPARVPPHRVAAPRASIYHRLAMVTLAVGERPGLTASDLEADRTGPSYTWATLARLGDTGLHPWQIFFITGSDAFVDIASWRDYPAILDRAHFVVVSRPGAPASALADRLPGLAPRMIRPRADLEAALAGRQATAVILISADTTKVSSTELRDRVARGESLAGLVPAAVDAYIRRHGLYGAPSTAGDLHDD